jgi:hypothetical protein
MARSKLDIRPLRACGKRRHYTIESAEQHRSHLAAQERSLRPSYPPLSVYRCPLCDAYHVGHSS